MMQPQPQPTVQELYNNDPYLAQMQQRQQYPIRESDPIDMAERYGGIIKELSEVEPILDKFELDLRGKRRKTDGEIEDIPGVVPYIKSERAIHEYMKLLRSMCNLHICYSWFDEKEIWDYLEHANYTITRWLMLQGDEVPLKYRFKLAGESMHLINAAYMKARDGKMLQWTKGSINEGMNINHNPEKNKGLLDYIMPWRNKGG